MNESRGVSIRDHVTPDTQISGSTESQVDHSAGVEAPACRAASRRSSSQRSGLFAVSLVFASSSVTAGTLLTMLPFASALAIASLGQTLVVMQGGIDLSVAGGLSLYVVIVTKYPAGDNSRLLAGDRHRISRRDRRRLLNGFLIGRMRLNPIVATLGTNALLFGAVLWYTAGIPTTTTARLARVGGGTLARHSRHRCTSPSPRRPSSRRWSS